ncbi:hypothetical protein [Neptuniibacter sp.]|uniref:hypothetical protein n=1 Tax=Neptuniibacter sp. TaxID=1962643 RepID=UPI002622B4C8|nr:hypothetical protein [Neptuniibacter sp.]MCP4597297.1 general secretion pathway protein GspB [Neptuniibacter sp.]
MLKKLALVLIMMTGGFAQAGSLPSDPTQPAQGVVSYTVEAKDKVQEYKVNSLITGKKQRVAVVNGQRVHVGDEVNGATVLEINSKGVRINIRGEQKFISLAERKGFSKVKSGK